MGLNLSEFIDVNREEIIRRCRAKVMTRSSPPSTAMEINHGVPMFLNQLIKELRAGPSQAGAMSATAKQHGLDLAVQGFTLSEVVHDYGDVCQSTTDLALERNAAITTEDFRTLNRCLDDAIAGAVTEFARAQETTREGKSDELLNLTDTAITALDVIRTGTVGVAGRTGHVLHDTLVRMRHLLGHGRRKQSISITPAAVGKIKQGMSQARSSVAPAATRGTRKRR